MCRTLEKILTKRERRRESRRLEQHSQKQGRRKAQPGVIEVVARSRKVFPTNDMPRDSSGNHQRLFEEEKQNDQTWNLEKWLKKLYEELIGGKRNWRERDK